ncbi:hypothetical protein JCM6882_008462 [Rhodosporidiobolus microsporus]
MAVPIASSSSSSSSSAASPYDAHDPVPSTSQLPPPIPASLNTLPPELKALIVQKVAEADRADVDGDEDEGAWSDDDEGEEEQKAGTGGGGEGGAEKGQAGGAGGATGVFQRAWETITKLPRGEDGNPTDEALEKVRERLLQLAQPSGIEALTLVNKEFSAMAMQWMWRELDFESVSNESILHLITHVLPLRAIHVQSLAFGQSEAQMLRTDPPGMSGAYDAVDPFLPLPPQRAAVVEAAERLGGVPATFPDGTALSSEIRSRRTRGLLVAEVIRQCPNIVRVDCEGFPRVPPAWVDDLEDRDLSDQNVVYPVDHAIEALKAHARRGEAGSTTGGLTDLTFLVQDDGITTEGDVADLLLSVPHLLRLQLEMLVPSGPASNRDRLFRAFTSFTRLETLHVVEGAFVTDSFAALSLAHLPLKVLALAECEDLSFAGFWDLIHQFANTLEVLDLDGTPHANNDDETAKFLAKRAQLPKLDTLVLSTPHPAPFLLDFFAASPLQTLGFGFCPAVEYGDVERFMDLHLGTLRRIEVKSDAALSEAQVESLEVLCYGRGVECELIEGDDEDDESDFDGPSDFDDDDDEVDGWTEDDDDDMDGEVDAAGGWSDDDE